jgi:anti-sigma-K factor RskA
MDYSRPELADRLAAEYVLGTLAGRARRRFETLLPAHPALRAAVADWQRRLAPLAAEIAPVEPSAAVWRRVQAQLFPDTVPVRPALAWQRLAFWQGLAGFALVGVVSLGVLIQQVPPVQPPIVVVLATNPDAGAGAVPASFVASLSADGRSLVLKPVNAPALAATQAFELWAVPAAGAPRSLGLVSASDGATVRRAGLLQGTAAFAVSIEPAGGSTTGAPSGPIVSVGKLQT